MTDSSQELTAYCRQRDRVCPLPLLWNQLWEMLPNRKRVGLGWEPPLPLILAAWYDTSDALKTLRFTKHIQWAEKYGELESVSRFVRGLREEDWLHIGE
jgi:hypothetical protein